VSDRRREVVLNSRRISYRNIIQKQIPHSLTKNGVLDALKHSYLLASENGGLIYIRRFSIYQYIYIKKQFFMSRKKEETNIKNRRL
jgi:hypothetical protein